MMASSSFFFSFVSLAVMLPCLLLSVSATSYIDTICNKAKGDKAFCVKTLSAYPPAASATSTFQAAVATLSLGASYADKSAAFAGTAAKVNPKLKECQDAFVLISRSCKSASSELKEDPQTANYDVMLCYDSITTVKNLVGKNTDKASKTIISMTMMMEKFLALAVGATEAVGG
ncbi:PREDICTED: uncharacterized protein LOC104760993 [Camelina sativa]|uniref:Uncharacterized protein LOC104760993 n=1 Tax=Camelina sativa TaxID=90675 RepID=A0ABM0X8L0_CAMSA|nr:PREDICTED: uncharacterized protein LOC104760993 [Camelina sativa]